MLTSPTFLVAVLIFSVYVLQSSSAGKPGTLGRVDGRRFVLSGPGGPIYSTSPDELANGGSGEDSSEEDADLGGPRSPSHPGVKGPHDEKRLGGGGPAVRCPVPEGGCPVGGKYPSFRPGGPGKYPDVPQGGYRPYRPQIPVARPQYGSYPNVPLGGVPDGIPPGNYPDVQQGGYRPHGAQIPVNLARPPQGKYPDVPTGNVEADGPKHPSDASPGKYTDGQDVPSGDIPLGKYPDTQGEIPPGNNPDIPKGPVPDGPPGDVVPGKNIGDGEGKVDVPAGKGPDGALGPGNPLEDGQKDPGVLPGPDTPYGGGPNVHGGPPGKYPDGSSYPEGGPVAPGGDPTGFPTGVPHGNGPSVPGGPQLKSDGQCPVCSCPCQPQRPGAPGGYPGGPFSGGPFRPGNSFGFPGFPGGQFPGGSGVQNTGGGFFPGGGNRYPQGGPFFPPGGPNRQGGPGFSNGGNPGFSNGGTPKVPQGGPGFQQGGGPNFPHEGGPNFPQGGQGFQQGGGPNYPQGGQGFQQGGGPNYPQGGQGFQQGGGPNYPQGGQGFQQGGGPKYPQGGQGFQQGGGQNYPQGGQGFQQGGGPNYPQGGQGFQQGGGPNYPQGGPGFQKEGGPHFPQGPGSYNGGPDYPQGKQGQGDGPQLKPNGPGNPSFHLGGPNYPQGGGTFPNEQGHNIPLDPQLPKIPGGHGDKGVDEADKTDIETGGKIPAESQIYPIRTDSKYPDISQHVPFGKNPTQAQGPQKHVDVPVPPVEKYPDLTQTSDSGKYPDGPQGPVPGKDPYAPLPQVEKYPDIPQGQASDKLPDVPVPPVEKYPDLPQGPKPGAPVPPVEKLHGPEKYPQVPVDKVPDSHKNVDEYGCTNLVCGPKAPEEQQKPEVPPPDKVGHKPIPLPPEQIPDGPRFEGPVNKIPVQRPIPGIPIPDGPISGGPVFGEPLPEVPPLGLPEKKNEDIPRPGSDPQVPFVPPGGGFKPAPWQHPQCGDLKDGYQLRGSFPWQATLANKVGAGKRYFCAGTLISERHVLTPAHCVDKFVQTVDVLLVHLGNLLKGGEQNVYPVKQVIINPDYSPGDQAHNIAVVILAKDALLDDEIYPICLPEDEGLDFADYDCSATGWPNSAFKVNRYDSLRKLPVPIMSNDVCQNKLASESSLGPQFQLQDTFMCCAMPKGVATFQACSGGALACAPPRGGRYMCAGMVTVKDDINMGPNVSGMFLRIAPYLPWIRGMLERAHEQY